MKQIILIIGMLIASSVASYASIPDNLEEYGQVEFSTTDPEYEWSQADSKQIKVSLKSQFLELESKNDDGLAYSVVELPIDVEDNAEFLFGFSLNGFKPNDKSGFGMFFDYLDIRNYKAIVISKKEYQYFVVKDGVASMVKSGPVKHKGDSFKLIMRRENGGIEIQLNGIEVCKLRKIRLTSSYFGVFINGKGKARMPSFMMYIPEQDDTEQSTSNT